MQDDQLLTQYARTGSDAAFSQIVARHLALVYRTCRRELGSDPLAEDAAQVVFLLLARKAKTLRAGPSLAGWLYQTAVFVAKDVRKQEARRLRREEAVMQETVHAQTAPAPEWDTVEPLLNTALSGLKPADRDAVLLRFLEGHTLAETGDLLGISEDAARMRVNRALEKLRRYLTSHGAAVTGVVLAALLTAEAARPLPADAASTVTQATLQAMINGPAPNVQLLSKGVSHTMKIIKIKYAALAAGLLLAGASVPPLVHAFSQRQVLRQAVSSASPSLVRQQAFQVGLIVQECNLQAGNYISNVSNIGQIPESVSVNAETILWSREVPNVRKAQASRYGQVYSKLRQMGAPADISQWYMQTSSLLSKPLVSSNAIKAQALSAYASSWAYNSAANNNLPSATKTELTTDLAEMAEMRATRAEAATHWTKVDAWLRHISAEAEWDALLGSYTTDLHDHDKSGIRFPVDDLTSTADSLLRTMPQSTPSNVREDLIALVASLNGPHPNSPAGFVTFQPGDSTQQLISRTYSELCNVYNADPPRQ